MYKRQQKDTSLINFLGLYDVVLRAKFLANVKGTLTGYTMAALLFAALSLPMTRYLDYYINRDKSRMLVG